MEKLYKLVDGEYVEVDLPERYEMSDGVWLVQSKPHSHSISSLFWKVGDLKRPADIVTHAGLQSIEDELALYLVKLGNENSDEFKEVKEIYGNWISGPVQYFNVSASQLVTLFLRKIALNLEEGEDLSWDKFQMDFRQDLGIEAVEKMKPIEALYAFTKWLKNNNVKFRQNKNIG